MEKLGVRETVTRSGKNDFENQKKSSQIEFFGILLPSCFEWKEQKLLFETTLYS